MGLDRISNLPSVVKQKILECLPLKDAVRTSVLSRQWRYEAAELQHLVFGLEFYPAHNDNNTLAEIVNHVLSAHIGLIYKFQLFSHNIASEDLDRWILHLSKNSIKEFILVRSGQQYMIPSSLFSCQDMITLMLSRCLLEPPPTFGGFRNLRCLGFYYVNFTQDVFEHLIGSCPLLQDLSMTLCDNFSHLKIEAPNLTVLDVNGSYKDVVLVNTPNMFDVTIGLEDLEFYVSQQGVSGSSSNLVKILSCLPEVNRLVFSSCSLMYLAIGALPVELPRPCLYLTFLHVTLRLTNLKESLTALCLFRSCPVLQELQVQVFSGVVKVVGEGSWLDDNRICSFSQLRSVLIYDIRDVKPEVDFIRYLLLNSPVLERITVEPVRGVESSKLRKKLLGSRCVSVHAKLIVKNQTSSDSAANCTCLQTCRIC